jgi:hypothetical protein
MWSDIVCPVESRSGLPIRLASLLARSGVEGTRKVPVAQLDTPTLALGRQP